MTELDRDKAIHQFNEWIGTLMIVENRKVHAWLMGTYELMYQNDPTIFHPKGASNAAK